MDAKEPQHAGQAHNKDVAGQAADHVGQRSLDQVGDGVKEAHLEHPVEDHTEARNDEHGKDRREQNGKRPAHVGGYGIGQADGELVGINKPAVQFSRSQCREHGHEQALRAAVTAGKHIGDQLLDPVHLGQDSGVAQGNVAAQGDDGQDLVLHAVALGQLRRNCDDGGKAHDSHSAVAGGIEHGAEIAQPGHAGNVGQGDVSLGGVAHHAAEQGAEGAHQDDGHDDGKAIFDSRKMTFVLHEICNAQKAIHENVFQRFFHFRLLLISFGGWIFGSLFVSLQFVSS